MAQEQLSKSPCNASFDNDPQAYHRLRDCWLNRRREAFLSSQLINLPAGSRVLEIGCGTGWLLSRLARANPHLEWVGLDPLDAYIAFARGNSPPSNLRYFVGTAETVDKLLESCFHVILSNDMLHHVDSEEQVAQSLRHLAADGCRWLLIEPNCRNPYTFLRQALTHGERNFWPTAFLPLAQRAGWKKSSRRYLFLIPPFIKEPVNLLLSLERRFEQWPLFAGGICLELRLVR